MMKKILLAIVLLVVFAQTGFAQDCRTFSCTAPYDLTSGFSRFVSSATGQNFVSERITESVIKKAIKKKFQSGDIKVKLDSFSTRDLKAGRFKSFEVTAENVNIEGVYVSYFNAKTLCDFNYLTHDEKNHYTVKENIPLSFTSVITEDDLNNTMNSSDYKRLMNDFNSIGGICNLFKITSTSVKLENGKMYYIVKYALPFMRQSKKVVISADINVANGRIILDNAAYEGNHNSTEIDTFSSLLNYINPLDFSAKILENKDAKFSVKNVKITDGKIFVDGRITVLKDEE